MALIAKYVARHRLRDTRLLDTIADFVAKKAEYLDSKVRRASGGGAVGGAEESSPAADWLLMDCAGVSVSSGDPEAGVPLQPDELPALQPAAVLLPAGGSGGAEGAELAARHR